MKQRLKIAQALGVEPHELLIVEQEEPSASKLRSTIQGLLQEANRRELQLAYILWKALLQEIGAGRRHADDGPRCDSIWSVSPTAAANTAPVQVKRES